MNPILDYKEYLQVGTSGILCFPTWYAEKAGVANLKNYLISEGYDIDTVSITSSFTYYYPL